MKKVYKKLKHDIINLKEKLEIQKEYITESMYEDYKEKSASIYNELKKRKVYYIFFHKHMYIIKNLKQLIEEKNEKYIQEELSSNHKFFDNICGYPLDINQRRAIVTDNDRNLIVAGAGSGKSLTMIGKIHYLLCKKEIDESEILCISFTNETTKSLQHKLKTIYNYNIDVYTFHKLGYQIIKRQIPTIKVANQHILDDCIDTYFKNSTKQEFELILKYFSEFTKIPRGYKTKYKHITLRQICENKEERVRDKEEVIIANYLYLKGIEYTYERMPYGCVFHFSKKILHYYNFYNPMYTLELIDKKKTKDSIYIYKYHVYEKGLPYILERKIKNLKTNTTPLEKEKVYVDMIENNNDYIIELKNLLVTFMNIFKSNTKTLEQLNLEVKQNTLENAFLIIFEQIYTKYQQTLQNNNQIDVNDMLLLATKLTNNEYHYKPYKYILIDEFQDTSKVRYALIHNIIKHTNAKLIAVGDDFQSIYRFSGCDIRLFINFEKYFGKSSISYIENTYRNSQELIDIAGTFVMQNKAQIKKQLHSSKHIDNPIEIHYYTDLSTVFLTLLKTLSTGKNKIILGRNNKDIQLFKIDDIKIKDSSIYIKEMKETIPYLTVHKSKGLEYDYVFLINMKDDYAGFPSKIEEHQVLKMVLPKEEEYLYAEERRLFYVALTRAKQKVFILTPQENPSIFVKELENLMKKK